MTAPLHHLNQLYLHLPALNGQVAAHASVGQELQLMAQEALDKAYRRDLVEVVPEANHAAESGTVRPGSEPQVRNNLRDRAKIRSKDPLKRSARTLQSATDADPPLVSVRV
jgi:hypothetical protein